MYKPNMDLSYLFGGDGTHAGATAITDLQVCTPPEYPNSNCTDEIAAQNNVACIIFEVWQKLQSRCNNKHVLSLFMTKYFAAEQLY